MKLFHPPVDLNAPKGDDEIEYTPLQLTRLRTTAINFQRIVIGALALFFVGGLIAVLSARATDQQILDQRTQARYNECVRDNRQANEAIAAETKRANVLVAASHRGRTQTAEDLARADAYIADAIASAKELFPQRSCTPEAIDAHYTKAGIR